MGSEREAVKQKISIRHFELTEKLRVANFPLRRRSESFWKG